MEEFLNIPIFDDDFYKLIFLFVINITFLTVIIRWFYFEKSKNKDFLLTYYMISIVVFFLCFTLKKYKLDIGLAIGLFAIFGIIRYRTASVPIREMTYLFITIGISIMNAFANKKLSYVEIIFANAAIVYLIGFIEKVWKLKSLDSKNIIYEKIDNIKPENYNNLKTDLELRTGIEIKKLEVKDIDFVKDSATITVYYDSEK